MSARALGAVIVTAVVVAVMAATAFVVVANEPWIEPDATITVPGDPFDPPTSVPDDPLRGSYTCSSGRASTNGPGGWEIVCVIEGHRVTLNFDRPLPPEATP